MKDEGGACGVLETRQRKTVRRWEGPATANAAERLRSSKKRPLLALAMARVAVLVLQWGQKSVWGSFMREQEMKSRESECRRSLQRVWYKEEQRTGWGQRGTWDQEQNFFKDTRISSGYVCYENHSEGKRNDAAGDAVSTTAGMESSSQEENLLWTRLGWKWGSMCPDGGVLPYLVKWNGKLSSFCTFVSRNCKQNGTFRFLSIPLALRRQSMYCVCSPGSAVRWAQLPPWGHWHSALTGPWPYLLKSPISAMCN